MAPLPAIVRLTRRRLQETLCRRRVERQQKRAMVQQVSALALLGIARYLAFVLRKIGGTGKRKIGVFEIRCVRHCDMCDGRDHHWDYFGEGDPEGEPFMSCKHCPALRYMTQDDDANADY